MRTRKRYLYLVILLLLLPIGVRAYTGQQFWFTAPEMVTHSRDMSLHLYVYADTTTTITISMPAEPTFTPITFSAQGGQETAYILSPDYADFMARWAASYSQTSNRAVCIEAQHPISCYIQMTGVNGETYNLKGETALGTTFSVAQQNRYANCLKPTQHHIYDNAYAGAQVIATEDSTIITIYPSAPLINDSTAEPITVTLMRGQVYAFRAAKKDAEAHLSGTQITANKPIAVYTMDDSMSPYEKYFGEDAVADQLVPSNLLGTDYIAVGNGLKWEGVSIYDPQTDSTEFIPMAGKQALYIHRDHPVQVFQITGYRNEAGGAVLPPLEQAGTQEVHYTRIPGSMATILTIVTPTENRAAMLLNGTPLDTTLFHPVDSLPTWSYARLDMARIPNSGVFHLTSQGTIFHLGIIDALSTLRSKDGRRLPTSCSYGYFSEYLRPEPAPEVIIPDTIIPVETLVIPTDTPLIQTDTLPIPPVDTLPEKEKHPVHGHINLYMEGAYSHLPLAHPDVHWGLGYGVGAGVLYEYRKDHFLLDVGVGFLWQDVAHLLPRQQFTTDIIDTQGSPATLLYQVDRNDRSRMGYVEVPLLVGGNWNRFYLLGGVKVGVPVFGNTCSTADISDIGLYDQYFVPFEEMPNHGFRMNVPEQRHADRLTYKADTRLSLELGANLGQAYIHQGTDSVSEQEQRRADKVTYRLGVFADYGLCWPAATGTGDWLVTDDPYNYSTWQLNHVLRSAWADERYIQDFLVGVKLTISFGF